MSAALFWQIARYGISGGLSVATYVGLLWILVHFASAAPFLANAAAYGVATGLNYLLNFYWSFSRSSGHQQAGWRYLVVVCVGLTLNSAFVSLTTSLGVTVELSAVLFAVLWPLVSFVSLKFWALRP